MSVPSETRPLALPGSSTWTPAWRARDYRPEYLEGVVRVWQEWTSGQDDPVYTLAEIVAACEDGLGVVITHGSAVLGAAVARVEDDRAWIMLLAQDPSRRDQGLGSALLGGLEERLIARGVSRICALLPQSETRLRAFENSEFSPETTLRYFERRIAVHRSDLEPLTRLGASLLPRTLWRELAGMSAAKRLVESRLILPLARADLADQLGVRPPRAAMLFGPPGTGKSTFARAIASRLGWPFVELHPSRLAGESGGLANALRSRFVEIAGLEHAVVFIDEVDEIASRRDRAASPLQQAATNEMLKSIPLFREREGRLLVCATNFIRNLDPAFLRHGRFDYVLPIGLPDLEARQSIWRRYVPLSAEAVDLAVLAQASERFSPADIEFAARSASQAAFERVVGGAPADAVGAADLDTVAYLEAIAATRPTVTAAALSEFEDDIRALART
ncbi:ATP-binding protein [Microbacterium sp. RD1]|uniref:ATP-binding protein n=1 Tax=Microbacterium sp. RD1 TaxID=3457313 RepID=UPI003FA5BCF6